MELLYILYSPTGKSQRYLLIFPLGSRKGKLCLIDTTHLSESEIARLRSGSRELVNLSLDSRIGWVRKYTPNAYKNAYKEIKESNLKIMSKHRIN
jgi:hypothetical protein